MDCIDSGAGTVWRRDRTGRGIAFFLDMEKSAASRFVLPRGAARLGRLHSSEAGDRGCGELSRPSISRRTTTRSTKGESGITGTRLLHLCFRSSHGGYNSWYVNCRRRCCLPFCSSQTAKVQVENQSQIGFRFDTSTTRGRMAERGCDGIEEEKAVLVVVDESQSLNSLRRGVREML